MYKLVEKLTFNFKFAFQVVKLRSAFEGGVTKNKFLFSQRTPQNGREEREPDRVLLSYRSQNPKC